MENVNKQKVNGVVVLVIIFAFLQILDIVSTLWIARHGGDELNPLTVGLVRSWYYVPVKLLPVLMVSSVPYVANKCSRAKWFLVWGLSVVVFVMTLVVIHNVAQIGFYLGGQV